MTAASDGGPVSASYKTAESIARKRQPHLYRVARLFPDRERYLAFCATYASMRWVDDRVDEGDSAPPELAEWEKAIEGNFEGEFGSASYGAALSDTLSRFDLPLEPWQNLQKAMRYDLETRSFHTYQDFLDYAEGATVAPASVFATLLLMRIDGERYRPALPYPVIRDAVRRSAIACYEVHILRDAREDLVCGRNYFPQDELDEYHLDARKGLTADWRPYLRAYALRIRGSWDRGVADLQAIEGPMTPRDKLMLHLLVEFYGQSLQKIVRLNYDVWSDRHWPDAEDISSLLRVLGDRYEPGADLSQLAVRVVEDV
jgi:phytoene synthase